MALTSAEQRELDQLELDKLMVEKAAAARMPPFNPVSGLPVTPERENEAAAFWKASVPQRAMMMLKGTASSRAIDPLVEGGGAAAGARVGGQMAGPLGAAAGGGIGALGGYIANKLRHGDPVRPGGAAGAAIMGAIPGAPLARAGLGAVVREGVKQGAGNLAAKTIETELDEGRLPTAGETLLAGGSGALGATASKFVDKGARALAVETKAIQNAVRDRTLTEAAAAGYVIPPSKVNPSFVNKTLESLAGKAATAQEATIRNQEITNALARKAVGLPPNVPITEGVLKKVRVEAAEPYRQIEAMAKQAEADLEALKKSKLTAASAHEYEIQLADPALVKEMASLAKKAGADVERLKWAKHEAHTQFQYHQRSGDPKALAAARSARDEAKILEGRIHDAAIEMGKPELAEALKMARTRIAKAYEVEKALNLADANISAPILGRSLDKGTKLTNELKTIANFQQAFPAAAREAAGIPVPGVNQLLPMGAGIAAGMGSGPGLAAAALFAAQSPVRNAILSRPYQQFMAQPNYGIGGPDFAATLAQFTANSTGLGPNPLMQFLQQEYPAPPPARR